MLGEARGRWARPAARSSCTTPVGSRWPVGTGRAAAPVAPGGDHPMARAVRTRETQWTSTPLALPLPLADRVIGAVGLWFADGPPEFDDHQRTAFLTAASQCAQALDRARLHQAEHETAEVLQRSLLPGGLPALARLAGAARYMPGDRARPLRRRLVRHAAARRVRVGVVVGDVVGHGPPAAAVMGQLRSVLAAHCSRAARRGRAGVGSTGSPAACPARRAARVRACSFELVAGAAAVGSPPAIHRCCWSTAATARPGWRRRRRRGHRPRRARPAAVCRGQTTVTPGSTIVLYTDGLVERRGESSTSAWGGSRTPRAGCRT